MFNRKLVKRLQFKIEILRMAYESCFNEGQAKELKEQDKQIEQLQELVVDSLGMCFNPECESCQANQQESEIRAEKVESILQEGK